jgi:uncharacterized lipoprotein YajG
MVRGGDKPFLCIPVRLSTKRGSMYQRILFILMGIFFFSGYSNAQTIREKINQHAKDPKTKENAAKADVYIVDQKVKADSKVTSCKAKKQRKAESRRARKSSLQ